MRRQLTSKPRSTPTFSGVIPGGELFDIPKGALKVIYGFTGFDWTPSVRAGTSLILVGNDDRGVGSGGSTTLTVGQGDALNDTCLNDASPSSTPTPAAGGLYPSSTSSASSSSADPLVSSTSSASSSTANSLMSSTSSAGSGSADPSASSISGGGGGPSVGAIVGTVVGAAALLLALVLLLCMRRRRRHSTQKERPVNLLQDGWRDSSDSAAYRDQHLQYYQPEPFLLPGAVARDAAGDSGAAPRTSGTTGRHSVESTKTAPRRGMPRPGTPDRSSIDTGKQGSAAGPTPLRPMRIVQHEDARHVEAAPQEDELETIELPPAYTHIRRAQSARVPAAPTAAGGESLSPVKGEGSSLLSVPALAPAVA